jgi:hypothetical protein
MRCKWPPIIVLTSWRKALRRIDASSFLRCARDRMLIGVEALVEKLFLTLARNPAPCEDPFAFADRI